MQEEISSYEIRMVIEKLRKKYKNPISIGILDLYMRHFDDNEEDNIDLGIISFLAPIIEYAPDNTKVILFESLMEVGILVDLFYGKGDE